MGRRRPISRDFTFSWTAQGPCRSSPRVTQRVALPSPNGSSYVPEAVASSFVFSSRTSLTRQTLRTVHRERVGAPRHRRLAGDFSVSPVPLLRGADEPRNASRFRRRTDRATSPKTSRARSSSRAGRLCPVKRSVPSTVSASEPLVAVGSREISKMSPSAIAARCRRATRRVALPSPNGPSHVSVPVAGSFVFASRTSLSRQTLRTVHRERVGAPRHRRLAGDFENVS